MNPAQSRASGSPAKPGFSRVPLLLPGMLALVVGVLAGLARLGWEVPDRVAAQAGLHAAWMIGGFFGTVISLERAVALGKGWAYLAPAAAGLAGIGLLAGLGLALVQGAMLMAGCVLCCTSLQAWRRVRAQFTVVLSVAAGCWLAGSLAWALSGGVWAALPWWLAFLLLTIAGERLELTRLLPVPVWAKQVFWLPALLMLAGAMATGQWPGAGWQAFAVGMLLLAAWLLAFDIARPNLRQRGLTRYIAVALLGGYLWLALAGGMGVLDAFEPGHPWRDAALHAVGLGFVFSMVFGHAPIILPAVARIRIPWHPVFYLPLLALHLTLLLRVLGAIEGWFVLRHLAGLLNALVLLLFVGVVLSRIWRGKRLPAV